MIKIINPVYPITEGKHLAVIYQNSYCLLKVNDQKNAPSKINKKELLLIAMASLLTEDATIEQAKYILLLIAEDTFNHLIVHVCNSKKEAQSKIEHLRKN